MLATNKKRNDYQVENALGRMDRRITIMQSIIEDGDSNEDKVTGYEPINIKPQVWARVENDTGDTVMIADQPRHVQNTVFTIHYRTDLTIKNKVVFESRMYSILSVIPAGEMRKRRTKIHAEYLMDYALT